MPFVNDTKDGLFYRHWPAAEPSATVLVLHGYGEHSGHYRRLAAHLCRDGAEVWAVDHVGHGLTGAAPDGLFDSVEQLADNAAAVLKHAHAANPELPVVVVGHSLGAITAMLLAARAQHRISGLVLTGAPIAGSPSVDADAPPPIMSKESSYLDELAHDPYGFVTAAAEPNLWRCLDEALAEVHACSASLSIPVLLIYGDNDAFTSPAQAESWSRTFPAAQLITMTDGYHDIVNDVEHETVANHITTFVHAAALER
ncbi:alpha/beta hydrolase [Saccharopolyspora sp. ASAGF58]|uniref:alpha/beta hydrolase n=1 Tax=Saccharopolyspora sp. ASAGF58 TaxID=2719023 RepID=UPI00143FC7A2|nr:alpha/beta fold hydrolase [Saccharopolyspora sp. ASAGF58]QIZ37793.1 alpha/beta hydrolase [Saccharopolyspora sp. ASAGF58]